MWPKPTPRSRSNLPFSYRPWLCATHRDWANASTPVRGWRMGRTQLEPPGARSGWRRSERWQCGGAA
eukprot:3161021-Pleurochrysis_carterae.AAC.1